jgi:hypothetical protein
VSAFVARLLVGVALALGLPAAADPSLGFVHVEANVGGASGGHTALLLGDRVYHFQLGEERLLALHREDWDLFRFRYNELQNRPLHVAYVPVDAETLQQVRDHLTGLHLDYARVDGELAALEADLAALEALLGRRSGVPTRGAGLLDPVLPAPSWAVGLAERVLAALGPQGPRPQRAALETRLAVAPADPAALQAWREDLALSDALRALAEGWPLAETATLPAGSEPLGAQERASLESQALALEATLVRLVQSRRPDRAEALYTTLARHRAASRSLAGDRLVLVDPFPEHAPGLDRRAARVRRAELTAIADYLDQRTTQARARVLDGSAPTEPGLARLEALAARAREYRGGAEGGKPVREPLGALLPQRARSLPVAAAAPADADGTLAAIASALAQGRAQRAERRHYGLFTENCVTALARTLDDAFGGPEPLEQTLGGRVDPDGALAFWPLVYFGRVGERLAVERVERLPGRRERELSALRTREGGLRLYARESNTLSSRLYQRRDADGSFLLFTDDVFWPRPLYGALNLAWSAGDAALGLLTAPFDRGRRLERAGKGMLFSVPELVFVNIRKGSFDAAGLRRDSDAP